MENNKVICYIQYALKLRTKSPLCVSGGADAVTDRDVQKDFNGKPFIPGTSLAGALRSYLEECADIKHDDIDTVFGSGDKMSRVRISDLCFETEDENTRANVITRDGIKLEDKLAVKGAKFDMEAVDTGAICECFLVLTIREGDGDKRSRFEAVVERSLAGLVWGEIRLGAKKNRGFGEMELYKANEKVFSKKKVFTKDNIMEWLSLDRKSLLIADGNELVLDKPEENRYVTIRVPLKQRGGISIRRYSVAPEEVDYEHITSNNRPVIPGTSWNGAIRSRVRELLRTQLKPKEDSPQSCKDEWPGFVERCIDEWFGFVKQKPGDQKDKTGAKQSNIVIGESVIEGGTDLPITRTKVDRYVSSAMGGALYSEKSHFNGTLVLEIKVRKYYYNSEGELQNSDSFHEPIVGMLLLAIKDIQNGYLAIGGQTAIGRGIFEEAGAVELSGTDKDEKYFINAVGTWLKEKHK